MATSLERLTEWSKRVRVALDVSKGTSERTGRYWAIGVSITDPVKFHAYASETSLEEAAAKVIADLETVGVKIDG